MKLPRGGEAAIPPNTVRDPVAPTFITGLPDGAEVATPSVTVQAGKSAFGASAQVKLKVCSALSSNLDDGFKKKKKKRRQWSQATRSFGPGRSVPPPGISWVVSDEKKFAKLPDISYREERHLAPAVLQEIQELIKGRKTKCRPKLREGDETTTAVPTSCNPFICRAAPAMPSRLPPLSKVIDNFHTDHRNAVLSKEREVTRKALIDKKQKTALELLQENLPPLAGSPASPSREVYPPGVEVQMTAQRLMDQFSLTSCDKERPKGRKAHTILTHFFSVAAVVLVVKRTVRRLRLRQMEAIFQSLETFMQNRNLTAVPKRVIRQLWFGFNALDDDRSGCISLREFQLSAQKVHRQIDPMIFRRLDRDRSGTVNFPELLRTLFPCISRKALEELVRTSCCTDNAVSWEEAFSVDLLIELGSVYGWLTSDGGEKYTLEKYLKQAPTDCMAEEELRGQFQEADLDKDGCLSFKEFALDMKNTFKEDLFQQ